MHGWEYQEQAMRTNDGKHDARLKAACFRYENMAELLNGCLGLAGETGEFLDMVKKWIFHEKPLDAEHLEKELGDVMWYVAMICKAMGWSLDDVMEKNVAKLQARYPEGFDPEMSANRKEGDL